MAKTQEAVVYASLDLNDASHGGFLSDVNVTFQDCGFYIQEETQSGEQFEGGPRTVFFANLVTEDGESHEQWWTVGSASILAPSEDNNRLIVVPKDGESEARARGISDSCKFYFFKDRLKKAGFKESLWNELGANCMEGVKAHVVLAKQDRKDWDTSRFGEEKGTVVVDALIEVPAAEGSGSGKTGAVKKGPSSSGKAAGAAGVARPSGGSSKSGGVARPGKGAGKAKPEPEPDEDDGEGEGESGKFEFDPEVLSGYVLEVLGDTAQLRGTIYSRLLKLDDMSGDENADERAAYAQAINKDGFLDTMVEEGVLEMDGKKYKAA